MLEDAIEGWPAGAREEYVRDCNCPSCEALVERLDRYREGLADDGEHARLDAFGGAEA